MPRPPERPLTCVIVLNYNGRTHLEYCLPSIAATEYSPLRIIVVDNASTDDSKALVTTRYPQIEWLASDLNRGWSGGNNLGNKHAMGLGAQYVVLANNDIRVDPRWLDVAIQAAEQDPRIGIVGFRIMEPRAADVDAGFTLAMRDWTYAAPRETNVVDGMAMFVRAAVFEQIGLMDDGFFAYGEDNDFERRARRAGYRIVATQVPIWHRGQGSFGRMPLRAAALQIRNNIRLALKHESPLGVLYQLARHFAKGCLPFVKVDRHDPVALRLRPFNGIVNFFILLYAVAWNILRLPHTLNCRREDERRIEIARRQLELE